VAHRRGFAQVRVAPAQHALISAPYSSGARSAEGGSGSTALIKAAPLARQA